MMLRWVLGISVLFAAACSDDTCTDDKAYCDGNVAHYCNGGGDKGPIKWESLTCEPGLICMKGDCLIPPVVACSTPDSSACFEDGQVPAFCRRSGYWMWQQRCDATLGEACVSGVSRDSNERTWAACLVPSLGTCTEMSPRMCYQNRALACYAGYWRLDNICDSSLGEACHVSPPGASPWARCFSPDKETCSGFEMPVCRDSQILECAAEGRWAMTRDCAVDGLDCQNGACVTRPGSH